MLTGESKAYSNAVALWLVSHTNINAYEHKALELLND